MSERTRHLPRRSCLSVPASSEKMMAKASGLAADMVFLDLEDAVAPLEKEGARAKAVDAIKNHDWGDKTLCVRINSWDTKWTAFDVIEVVGNAGERLDEVMLPKVDTAAEVVALDLLLRQVEIRAGLPAGHIGIEAQIETARGLINVEDICAASPRLETVILGPVDFSASMGMPSLAGGLAHPRIPRRLLPLRVHEDPAGGPGPRPPGHRRAVREDPGSRRVSGVQPADPDPRLRREVGPSPPPRSRS